MPNKDDIAACKKIMRKHGKSYAFATRFFPQDLQDATAILYAFFRIPDDMVDETPGTTEEKTLRILSWKQEWNDVLLGKKTTHPVLKATHDIFIKYKIPQEYGDAFLQAMIQDLTVTKYRTYQDLEKYMYGSASVVGLIMSHVIGFKNEKTLLYAKALGEAMQLTNFIRDIKEDYEKRGRIYLPQEDLEKYKVNEEDIQSHKNNENIKRLLTYEIQRARELYRLAEQGIDELAPGGRLPVRVASRCYEAILKKIEAADYNIFAGRAHTTLLEKLIILFTVWKQQKNTQ